MYDNLIKRISKKFGRELTKSEIKYITEWKEKYGMLDNIIIEAVERAIKQKSTDISFKYINAIILNWHSKGVRTYGDITKIDNDFYKTKKEKDSTKPVISKKNTKVKNFVLDTNILIHNPYSIFKFENNNIYIPYIVLEELDNFKNEKSDRGYSVREASRLLKQLRSKGNLLDGVVLNDDGGKLFITFNQPDFSHLPIGWEKTKKDNLILLSVLSLKEQLNQEVILVSNDCGMQIKADLLKIPVEEYKNDRLSPSNEVYRGCSTIYVEDNIFNDFCRSASDNSQKMRHVEVLDAKIWDKDGEKTELTDNDYVIIKNSSNGSMLGKYFHNEIFSIKEYDEVMGISPRNVTQKFLLNSLMTPCDDIPLTIVNGPAGTGKTLMAIACGLEQVMEQKLYKKVLVCRANVMMDEDIGFLPGSEMDKISPLLRGVYDNLDIIFGNEDDTPAMMEDKRRELFQRGYIGAESLAYLRGRSINNTFIIIDETQNTTPRQIYSILTRVGIGSSCVLLGDVNQCDNFRLDSRNNGLTYAINKMKESPLTDIITFDEKDCVRSVLAKDASERLKI